MSSQSLWTKLNRFPPILVRLMARDENGILLPDEILHLYSQNKRCPLSIADVKHLSYLPAWDEVPVGKMETFLKVCGVDFGNPTSMRRANRYLKKARWTHLRRDPEFPEYRKRLGLVVRNHLNR